ncbi:PTS sugar transporter subunit IIA [Enterobacteriaceae bacterium ESL0689]|nr:PTS sugar transporter subunit IIA [Enterobacteriaceae bacterium ESL0689]
MSKNLWVFICTHGDLSTALIDSAEMIVNKLDDFYPFSCFPDSEPEYFSRQIEYKLQQAPGPVLCLVDLIGGMPCNQCIRLSQHYDLQIVSGVNLPMLLELNDVRNEYPLSELIKYCLDVVSTSSKDVLSELNQ